MMIGEEINLLNGEGQLPKKDNRADSFVVLRHQDDNL
jgi:hypothetical protein